MPQEYGVQPGQTTFNFTTVLYDPPGSFHPTHYNSEFGTILGPLAGAIGRQANLLPLASPSSGILLSYDASVKTFVVSTDSLGPILGERGDTIGPHKLFLGFSYQYFDFDQIDGINLRSVPAVLTHTTDPFDNSVIPGDHTCSIIPSKGSQLGGCAFVRDAIVTKNSVALNINQYTGYITFGLTTHVDVSMVIPFETVRFNLYSQATIVPGSDGSFRPTPGSPDTKIANQNVTGKNGPPYFLHLFKNCPNTSPSTGIAGLDASCVNHTFPDPTFIGSGSSPTNSASGIGDVVARVKWNALSGEHMRFATGLDARFPSGDALNFLGSGSYGVKPFLVVSYKARVEPHALFGYEWNSNSILSSRVYVVPPPNKFPQNLLDSSSTIGLLTGQKGYMPSDFLYTAGIDAWVTKWLTGAFDVVGARFLRGGTESVAVQSYAARCTAGCLAESTPVSRSTLNPSPQASYSVDNASIGAKIRPIPKASKLVLTANVLVRLDNGGLHSKAAPLVGLGYTF